MQHGLRQCNSGVRLLYRLDDGLTIYASTFSDTGRVARIRAGVNLAASSVALRAVRVRG